MIIFQQMAHRHRRALAILLLLFVALLSILIALPREAPPAAAQTVVPLCGPNMAVPLEECTALVDLYNATGGAAWLRNDGWLTLNSPLAPCDWYGVTCAGGHVVRLSLDQNRLSGSFPRALGDLPRLQQLELAGNQLNGAVPPAACTLAAQQVAADLAYNALEAHRADIRFCLERIDPGWATTQTIAPRDLRLAQIAEDAVNLTWTPLSFALPGGYYEISFATAMEGSFTIHGRTTGSSDSSYMVDGLIPGTTYFLRLQAVTPANSGNADELRSEERLILAVTRAPTSILLMVYFPADNDLDPYVDTVIERLRLGSLLNPNVQTVMLADRAGSDDTELLLIAGGQVQSTGAVEERWGRRELNTADQDVLSWFLRYARNTYPAEREIVSLMGHGLALAPEIAWPHELPDVNPQLLAQGLVPPLPKGLDPTPGDITDRGYLSTIGLGQALAAATDNGTNPFDLLFFDQCFQGSLDTLYEVRTAAEVFVASPNYAWLAAPYDRYLAFLAPAASNEELGNMIIATYQRSLNDRHPNVIFTLRRADIEAIAGAVSDLGLALSRAVQAGERSPIANATRESRYVDTTQCGRQNLTLGPPDELIGVGTFVNNLRRNFPLNDAFGVQAAASRLQDLLLEVRKTFRVGVPYIAPDEFWDYDNTLTILAPLPPASPPAVIWRSSIYTETMPLLADWTPLAGTTVTVTTSFAFVRDGTWDEFLAAWYAEPIPPTVGEWCNYAPPALVDAADEETLDLALEGRGPTAVDLNWSTTTNQDLAAYLVYRRGPYDIAWVLVATLPPDQRSIELRDLAPGSTYQFRVVAQDAPGLTLAQSADLDWLTIVSIYLPLVR